jgi:hypothetical protein
MGDAFSRVREGQKRLGNSPTGGIILVTQPRITQTIMESKEP